MFSILIISETSALYYPPSIRVMVTASDSLDLGTLFLVTLTGTTLGRDENLGHGILLPDEQVSKVCSVVLEIEFGTVTVCISSKLGFNGSSYSWL